jgi:hypothetical protein
MTSDVLLILFLPFLAVLVAATVWLRLSARRIDRLQAEAAAEKAAATSVQTAEAATADRWEEGFRKVRASWKMTPEAIMGEAIALAETRNANPASKADKDVYRHRSSGIFVKQAGARPSGQRAKVYTKRPMKEQRG